MAVLAFSLINISVISSVKFDFLILISTILAPLLLATTGIREAGWISPVVPIIMNSSAFSASSKDNFSSRSGIASPKKTKSGFNISPHFSHFGGSSDKSSSLTEYFSPHSVQIK